MGIVQTALAKLLTPAIAETVSMALDPIRGRLAALEARPVFGELDRAALDKAGAMVAEFEAIAAGETVAPAASPVEETVTVPEIK